MNTEKSTSVVGLASIGLSIFLGMIIQGNVGQNNQLNIISRADFAEFINRRSLKNDTTGSKR
jgi:hypothetical protein